MVYWYTKVLQIQECPGNFKHEYKIREDNDGYRFHLSSREDRSSPVPPARATTATEDVRYDIKYGYNHLKRGF